MQKTERTLRILVVGQTPPPFGGQAVMIQLLLEGKYEGVSLHHVRMNFSRQLDSTGKWRFSKLWECVTVLFSMVYTRFRWGAEVLYYPPSGPRLFPVMRDIFLLLPSRWLFRATIFHFHASGLTSFRGSLHPALRGCFDLAFRHPELAIRLSPSAPAEGINLGCKDELLIANGIEDTAGVMMQRTKKKGERIRILHMALLTEDKGVLVTVEAVHLLLAAGLDVELVCVGKWESPETAARAWALIEPRFRDRFAFPGVLAGEFKWAEYKAADIFCFPSFFHSETFPLVLLEAMCFSLPIVSTRWRGIPDVVREGRNALLVEMRDASACARALEQVVLDDSFRDGLGRCSRALYEALYTIDVHRAAMQYAFSQLKRKLHQ